MEQDEIERLHDEAVAEGKLWYTDPETGLKVLTRLVLERQKRCCKRSCRHCPWESEQGYVAVR